jgi:hypothetical protein
MNQVKVIRACISFVSLSLMVSVSGCGGGHSEDDGHGHAHGSDGGGHGHAHGHGAEEGAGAEFDEAKGLIVHEEASKVIGLKTAEVTEERLALKFSAMAQVFRIKKSDDEVTRKALASAMISSSDTETLEVGKAIKAYIPGREEPLSGHITRLDSGTREAIERVEAIIEVPLKDDQARIGTFLKVEFAGKIRDVFAMPRNALLKAATGNFAYVKNGDRFLRTEVEVGASSETMIEVLGGVYPGDVVASEGVEDLWLIELRFTKGGGHSH